MTEFYDKSNSVEWYTPPWILFKVEDVIGKNYLDPALPGKTDGLKISWTGNVFLNPPYGRGVTEWFEKLRDSVYQGSVKEYIVLWKCAPETRSWRVLMSCTDVVAFPHARIHFIDGFTKMASKRATFPSAFFYHGPNVDRFMKIFNSCSMWQEIQAGVP